MVCEPEARFDGDMNTEGSTNTEEQPSSPPPPPPSGEWKAGFDRFGTLRRSTTDRKLAGVCGGIAEHFNIDATLVRILFVLFAFFGGGGLLAYLVIWLVTPSADNQSDPWGNTVRAAAVVIVLLLAVLSLVSGDVWGDNSLWMLIPLGILALIGLGIYALWTMVSSSTPAPPQQPQYAAPTVYAEAPTHSAPTSYAAPPVATAPMAPAPAPKPKPTGTLLFWPTMALIAIASGILGIYDHTHSVSPVTYVILALAIIGVMTTVGAFAGRPGGLVPVGILTVLALAVVSTIYAGFGAVNPRFVETTLTPTQASQIKDVYEKQTGSFTLDLSQVQDPEALIGRTIAVNTRAGVVNVELPPQVPIKVVASVEGFGAIEMDGIREDSRSGFQPRYSYQTPGTDASKTLTLFLNTKYGVINVWH